MIIDYVSGSSPLDFDTDLCIFGAGPAGIAIARAFLGTSVKVCLVESGGLEAEESSQALYEGTSSGLPPDYPASSRLRVFGGGSNVWGGGCVPLSNLDLGRRPWVPHSGWPISPDEIEQYYAGAKSYLHIDAHEFIDGSSLRRPIRNPVSFDSGQLVNKVFAYSTVRFGTTYRAELDGSTNITVVLRANLLSLEASPSASSVRAATIGSLHGRKGVVRARHYVLACGGMENARLLLMSRSVVPNGLGNEHDLVGRFFMDHPAGKIGTIFTDNPDLLTQRYDQSLDTRATPAFAEICLSDACQTSRGLLNARVRAVAVEGPVPTGVRAMRELRSALRSADCAEVSVENRMFNSLRLAPPRSGRVEGSAKGLGKLALQMGLGAGDIANAYVRKLARKPTVKSSHVDLFGYFEQSPNPDSRITLGRDTDALGQPRVHVDWRLTSLDRHTYRTAAAIFGAELARSCRGRFQMEPWLRDGDGDAPQLRGTAHHMGTTRMSDSPREGVVDRRCRVHGVDNLHVAGSSVFPRGGWAFPTFSIVALSLRLADRLHSALQ